MTTLPSTAARQTDLAVLEMTKGELAIPAELTPPVSEDLTPVRPKWMKPEDESEAQKMAEALVAEVKASPADVRLLLKAQALGQDGNRMMVQPLALYDKKVTIALRDNQEGSKVNQTLLDLKRQMDLVNPAVLRSKPLPVRWTLGLLSKVPDGDKVLKMIYESRETVRSTVNGLVENLRIDADNIEANVEDLAQIYRDLLTSQQAIERDIYVGQMVLRDLKEHLASMDEGPERENVMQFTADLTTQVISLMGEENLNLQFFAGAQALAKLSTAQLHNIRNLGRLLQRSVLANLGLNVAAGELVTSMQLTKQLGDAISNTVSQTAADLKKAGSEMTRMRSQGALNLAALESACSDMEQFFEGMARANGQIIELGGQTMRHLEGMTSRLRRRVESGHASMVAGSVEK